MTTYSMPWTPAFTDAQFYLEANTQTFTSPLSKATQRSELDGARWTTSLSLPAMDRNKAAPWVAFFRLLRGRANTFYAYDPDCKTPRGLAGGTPLVKNASQTGYSLTIDGATPSAIFLKAADYLSYGGELNQVTADCTADVSGNVTLALARPIINSPADNAPIITNTPTCTMIMSDDSQCIFSCNANGIYQPKTFTAYEVF
jgi:hypothetical protein